MATKYQIVSERDNRVVVGQIDDRAVAEGELKRLAEEAARHAPNRLNVPSEEAAASSPVAAQVRATLLADGPAAPESFRLEEIEIDVGEGTDG